MTRPLPQHPVIRAFNVKFSPNLGDGLLSECLEQALIELGASPETHSIDLAARKAYGDVLTGRRTIMETLQALPAPVRRVVVRLPVAASGALQWRPHYRQGLTGADAVVIGGGNLVSDIDLNFPTKLTLAMEEAERLDVPVAIYASGVTSGWSRKGTAMLAKAFSKPQLKGVFVRDADSAALWDEALGAATGHRAQVVRDPGLLAAEIYPTAPKRDRGRPVAGIGIMSQIAIRYHADKAPTEDHLDRWYLDVARGLIEAGFALDIFTNGSPEDRHYLDALRPKLAALGDEQLVRFPTQRTPQELCAIIAGFDVLIAYRMHAVIAAYSLGVPAIGLAWDRKLRSFMASVGRERFFRDVDEGSAAECVALAVECARDGIDDAERRQVISEARDGVRRLYDLLRSA